jgi:hypothetical protein
LASNFSEKLLDRLADFADRLIERGLIGAGGLAESAHLADKLQRRGGDFFIGSGGFRPAEYFDAAAHTCHHMK